ncbi:MAG: hypothetical protein AB7P07_06720 [Hyphomonadaceae bacterium]
MNERQRDLFLWVWSRRRAPGQAQVALRGALIGALGGVLFTLIMAPGAGPGVHAYDTAGQLFGRLSEGWRMLAMAAPAFAALGWFGAGRVYASQEATYQAMLANGAHVPTQKPQMRLADRGPALAVGVAALLIAGFILFVAIRYG